MVLAGQLDLYEKFHPPPKKNDPKKTDKPSHYGSIESDGDLLNLNLTWNMGTGFPALCGNELCLVGGSIGKWKVSSRLWLLRSQNSERWERIGIDWRSGRRTYVSATGYRMEENVILTPGKTYGSSRSGRSISPIDGAFSYRISYDKSGRERSTKIIKKEMK
jgi:hypothetical protein